MAIPDEGARHNATAAALAKKKKKVKVKKPPAGAVPAKNPNTGVLEMPPLPGASSSKPKPKSVVVKKKQPPKPLPPMIIDPLLDMTGETKPGKPQRSVVFKVRKPGKPPRSLDRDFTYVSTDQFFATILGKPPKGAEKNAIEAYNQRREQLKRERDARAKKVAEAAKNPYKLREVIGSYQTIEDYIEKGKVDYPGTLSALGKALGKAAWNKLDEADDWLDDIDNAAAKVPGALKNAYTEGIDIGPAAEAVNEWLGRQGEGIDRAALRAGKWGLGSVKALNPMLFPDEERDIGDVWGDLDRFGKTVFPWVVGEEYKKATEGRFSEINTPLLLAETGLLFVPIKGIPSLATVVLRKALGRSATEGIISSVRATRDIQHRIALAQGLVKGRKVWSEHLQQEVETAEPVARSRFGRGVEIAAERARRRIHQTPLSVPLSKTRLMLNGDQKIFEEIARTIQRTSVKLDETDAKAIFIKGAKLDTEQKYAYLLIAEGIPPEEQVAVSRALVRQYLAQGEEAKAAAQAMQGSYLAGAAKYVEVGPNGMVFLRADAPEVMHEIMEHWRHSQAYREDLYENMGLLTKEQIYNRIQGPGRKHMRRSFELWRGDIKDSAPRLQYREDTKDLGWRKGQRKAHLDLVDAMAFRIYQEMVDSKEAQWYAYNDMLDQGIDLSPDALHEYNMLKGELDEFGSFEDATPKDIFWSISGGVLSAFPRSIGRSQNLNELTRIMFRRDLIEEKLRGEGIEPTDEAVQAFRDDVQALLEGQQLQGLDYKKIYDSSAVNAIAKTIRERDLKLPEELQGEGKLEEAIDRVFSLAEGGAHAKDWYNRAAQNVLLVSRITGVPPQQIAALFAVFSQAADTVSNVKFLKDAVDQWQHYGEVYTGRFASRQGPEAESIMMGEAWEGRKRNSFYQNIIESIDPSQVTGKPVTVDRWVVRMFMPKSKKDVPAQYYDTFEQIIQEMAVHLGWEPKQVQAAAWVQVKQNSLDAAERLNVRHKAGAPDAFEYGIERNWGQESLFEDIPPTHPQTRRAADALKRKGGGFTLDRNLLDADPDGFMVSYGAYEFKVKPSKFGVRDLELYRDAHQEVLSGKNTYVGGWHNPDNGVGYLDISKNYKSKAAALKFGREQGQLAITDLKELKRVLALGNKATDEDWGKAFPSTGLSEAEADKIKQGLRGAIPKNVSLPAELTRKEFVPQAEEIPEVKAYEDFIRSAANRLFNSVSQDSLKYAEETIWKAVVANPNEPWAVNFRAMSDAADQAKYASQDRQLDELFGPAENIRSAEFSQFFTDANQGKYAPSRVPNWQWRDSRHMDFMDDVRRFSGGFDTHVETSIPDYRGVQVRKGVALAEAFPGASVLDLMSSTGSWGKALSLRGMDTTSLDASDEFAQFFAQNPVPGAKFVKEAFQEGFEWEGTYFPHYNPTERFDIVNESIGFQFISPERDAQIAEAKRLMKKDGIFFTDEKVVTRQWDEFEAEKDAWKSQYYTPEAMEAKAKEVLGDEDITGMRANMVTQEELEAALAKNFKHVEMYWDNGNFKGYVASDDRAQIDKFLKAYDSEDVPIDAMGTGPGGEFVYGKRDYESPYSGLSRETLDEMDASRESDIWGQPRAFDTGPPKVGDYVSVEDDVKTWHGVITTDKGDTFTVKLDEGGTFEFAKEAVRHADRNRVPRMYAGYEGGEARRLTSPHPAGDSLAGLIYNVDPADTYWERTRTHAKLLADALQEHGNPDPDKYFIALHEEVAKRAPSQVLAHESLGHYFERIVEKLDLPLAQEIRRIYSNSDGSIDGEKIAEGLERYLLEGSTRKTPEGDALNALAAEGMEDYAEIRKIFKISEDDFGMNVPDEEWITPEIRAIYDAMFLVEGKRNEGIWAADPADWDKGQYYLAVQRGLPHSWRQPYRRLKEYRSAVSLMIAPGRKGAISMMGMDQATRHQWGGFLRDFGFFRNDLTKSMGESGIKAARLGSLAKLKMAIVDHATPIPQNPDDLPIRLFPDYTDAQVASAMKQVRDKYHPNHQPPYSTIYREARSILAKEKRTNNETLSLMRDLMDDMEFGRRKISYDEFNNLDLPEIEAYREMHFPRSLEGEPIEEVVRKMLQTEVDEIPGIVWVPRDALDATGFTSKTISTGQMDPLVKAAGFTFDALNAWPKMFLLQLNPAYYTMNLIGNGAMLFMQQGAFAPWNAYRASLLSRLLGEEWSSVVDNLMGSGVMKLADVQMGTHALGPLNFLPHIASNLVDKIPRRAAWLHEIDRLGFREPEMIKNLLSMAHDGNEGAVRIVDHATRRANDALVDYERLNPFEKKVVTRVIFFYPWIKGATRWTMRYPLEHPVQALAFATLFGLQQWSADRWIDEDRPWYNWLDVPLPLTADRYGEPVRYVWNPRQALTFTTPLEMAQTILKFAGAVESGQPLASIMTPVLESTLIALAGKRPFDNAETERNFGTFLGELWGLPPIVKKFQELGKSTEGRLYPRTLLDQALAIAFGSLAPKPIDTELAKWRGSGKTGIPPNREYEQKIKDYETLTGKKVGPEIHEAAYAKLGWEYLRLEAGKKKGSKLTEKEQIALLWTYATSLKPELKSFDDSVMKYLAMPEAYGKLRYRIEALIGWDVLYAISEYTAKAKAKAGVEPEEEWHP